MYRLEINSSPKKECIFTHSWCNSRGYFYMFQIYIPVWHKVNIVKQDVNSVAFKGLLEQAGLRQ